MGSTQDVTLYDELDNAAAIVVKDSTLPSAANTGVALVGGTDGTLARLMTTNTSGNPIVVSRNVAVAAVTSGSATAAGGTVNVTVPTGFSNQCLLLLEVRPNTSSNNFDVAIFRDSGRTKTIYKITGITDNELVVQDYVPMILDASGNMYMTITNNNVSGSRTYTIEGVVEVNA